MDMQKLAEIVYSQLEEFIINFESEELCDYSSRVTEHYELWLIRNFPDLVEDEIEARVDQLRDHIEMKVIRAALAKI